MRVLVVGPFEDWTSIQDRAFELRRVAGVEEAIQTLEVWQPDIVIVDALVIGSARAELVARAEAIGSRVIASPNSDVSDIPDIRIPGSTMAELERHAIVETLKAVDGSTSRAAKMLGISVRKIQYRLRSWRESGKPAEYRKPVN